ncbi:MULTISPECIES: hypothetical protein [unclassified Halomonas]|nr:MULTISPECIES: hypothetical protein [unclassified Halomonas]
MHYRTMTIDDYGHQRVLERVVASERASIPGHTLKQIAEAIKNG